MGVRVTIMEPNQITGNVDPLPCGRIAWGCLTKATHELLIDGRQAYYYCAEHIDSETDRASVR